MFSAEARAQSFDPLSGAFKSDVMATIEKTANGSETRGTHTPPSELPTALDGSTQFRRLKSKELVLPGDYVKEGENSYQLWNGPRGFQAASFHKEVYRPQPKK
jgi:hypothetical protein